MTMPSSYRNHATEVRFFLSSYRALLDAKSGISQLENHLKDQYFLISDWKVLWIGTCALLRTSIDLFKLDSKSCINSMIKIEIENEWRAIADDREVHEIYWDFLKRERDAIIHEYEWRAYVAWLKSDGSIDDSPISLLGRRDDDSVGALLMRSGKFKGLDSLDLLKRSAQWVEDRIYSAIRRAGFDPNERRGFVNFAPVNAQPADSGLMPSLLVAGLNKAHD